MGGKGSRGRAGGAGKAGSTDGTRTQPAGATHPSHPSGLSRLHPPRPIVSVGAVIVDGDRVLLIKRAHEPLKGAWSIPGGVVELGETLREALVREVREETGLDVEVGPVLDVIDRVQRAADGRVEYHFVIIDCLCRQRGGTLASATDAADAIWVSRARLDEHDVTPSLRSVIERAMSSASRRNTRGRRGAR